MTCSFQHSHLVHCPGSNFTLFYTQTIVSLYQYFKQVTSNICNVAIGKKPQDTMPKKAHIMQVVPFGTRTGIMQFNGMVTVANVGSIKDEIRHDHMGVLSNRFTSMTKVNLKLQMMPKVFAMAESNWFGFLPIHIGRMKDMERKGIPA